MDLIGQRFGKLIAKSKVKKDTSWRWIYLCQCDCGNFSEVRQDRLRSGETKSCGCSKGKSIGEIKHGHVVGGKRSPMYVRWYSMIARCNHKNRKNYQHYGAKGVKVCDRWRKSFSDFLSDMGEPPTDSLGKPYHLDRIDPAGDYSPDNCRWITAHENRSRAQNLRWSNVK